MKKMGVTHKNMDVRMNNISVNDEKKSVDDIMTDEIDEMGGC